jgi:hypothetical protein
MLGEREDAFMRLKLEGLLDAAEVWAKRCPLDDLIYEDAWGQPLRKS